MRLGLSIFLATALAGAMHAQPALPTGGKWTVLKRGLPLDWPRLPGLISKTGPIQDKEVLSVLESVEGIPVSFDGLIWEFQFATLTRGKPYLLVSQFCRGDCGGLDAIYCEQRRCFHDSLSGMVVLGNDLVDVDGDGLPEVVTAECIDWCSGYTRLPTFIYSIYKFIEGKGFIDITRQAANYYREHLLPRIEIQKDVVTRVESRADDLQALSANIGRVYDAGSIEASLAAAARYAYNDYRRRVLGEKDAGLEDAIRWSESDNEWRLGLEALAHIPNPLAETRIVEATRSQNSELAEWAKGRLKFRNELKARGLVK
jgi:hypothetical protein